jgi:hypothetical protein
MDLEHHHFILNVTEKLIQLQFSKPILTMYLVDTRQLHGAVLLVILQTQLLLFSA